MKYWLKVEKPNVKEIVNIVYKFMKNNDKNNNVNILDNDKNVNYTYNNNRNRRVS